MTTALIIICIVFCIAVVLAIVSHLGWGIKKDTGWRARMRFRDRAAKSRRRPGATT